VVAGGVSDAGPLRGRVRRASGWPRLAQLPCRPDAHGSTDSDEDEGKCHLTEPGRTAAAQAAPALSRSFWVRTALLPEGTEPDTVPEEVLLALLRANR
jgi:hypothetical protein